MKLRKIITLVICAVLLAALMPMMPADAAEVQTMKSSDKMIEVLKKMEGFSAKPYWDYGQYSIGYGSKCPSDKVAEYQKTGITEAKAQEMLEKELEAFEKDVSNFARTYKLKLNQHQFDALVCFTYNCGPAWMSDKTGYFNTAVRSGDMGSDLIYGMCLYSKAGDEYLLTERRLCEANMYINGIYKASNAEGETYPKNYKWVFLDGNGGKVRYSIYGYDANKKPVVSVQFTQIPTGVDSNGKPFVYTLAGWYTSAGTRVDSLSTALSNGQKLYAKWKDPDGNIVNLTGKQDVVTKKVTVTHDKVNVRSGPGLSYGVVTTVSKGTTLTVTAIQDADGYTWGKTEKGWLSLSYTTYFDEPDSSGTGSSTETFPKTGTVNGSDVRYRTEPSTGTVMGTKQKGDRVTIVEEKSVSGTMWGKMSDGYWICLDYVTYDSKKVTAIELIVKPTKLKYSDTSQPLKLEGSVMMVTYADGTIGAMTLNRDMVTSFKATSKTKATVAISYQGKTLSFQVTLGKSEDLIITKQPTNVFVANGEKATTTITATGDGLKYQWYICNPGSSTYAKSSLTGNSYYVTMKESISGRKAYCLVTDKYGDSVKSDVIVLGLKPTITKQPTNVVAEIGTKATTTITATGDGLKYQWYICNPGSSTYSKSSLTGDSYYVTMKESVSGRKVYCLITDRFGNTVKSNVVTFSAKLEIIDQPENVCVANGKTAGTSVKAIGEGLKYQWYICNPGSKTYTKSSVTGNSYSVTMKDSISGRKIYCVITDKYGNSVKTDVVMLTNKVMITKQPANASAELGSKVTVSVTAVGNGLKYQWYICNPGSKTYAKSSLTGDSYYVTMKENISGRKVYCVVTDKNGKSVKSNVVTLTAKLAITEQPQNTSVILGEKATTTVTVTGAGLSYQWYICNPGSSTYAKSSLTGNSYYVTMKENISGRKVYCVITDKHGKTVKTDAVTLTAAVAVTRQPEDISVKMGERASVNFEATGVGLSYQWYLCDVNNSTYTKSSLTGTEYYVTMKETNTGRKVYCLITDRYGNTVKTDVVTLQGVDAVKVLRGELESRNEEIVITYLQSEILPDDSTVAVDVFNEAIAHTGVSTQGDYIYRHIKSLHYNSACEKQGDYYLVTLTYTVTYRTTAQQEAQVDVKVKEILDELNVYNATDYQKVKAVYGYLCANVGTPVMADGNDYTTYGALIENSAVCHGFSAAFYRLMLELDVDVRLISGKNGTVNHGWNIVAINGVYYNVDATKDAGFAFADYNYFLKADSSIPNYVRDQQYSTPEFMAEYPMAEKDY